MSIVVEERAGAALAASALRASLLPVWMALAVGAAALGLLFSAEIRAAIEVWNASTAYGHCYLVLPMALYLVWDRRQEVAGVPVRPEPALALLAILVAAAWLAAERLGIMEGRQLMAVAALQVLLLAILGRRMYWALSGPLLYLFFLVPFGAFLTPALQHFTARFTTVGLNLLGIPNYTDDLIIEIPAGTFFVAEACAGLRFLIAAIAFGVFYALLNYRSPVRRGVFILASIIVPIVANGFRALGIVVLGHILGSAEAAAADHVIYGWVFFSFVMLLLVAAGMPLREAGVATFPSADRAPTRPATGAAWSALAAVLLAASGPGIAALFNAEATAAPLAGVPGLRVPPGCQQTAFSPGSVLTRVTAQVSCGDTEFAVAIEAFPARSTAAALIAERRKATAELSAEDTSYTPLPVSGNNGDWTLVRTTAPNRVTAIASWVDGQPAQGGLAGRLQQARDSVLGGSHSAVLMTIGAADRRTPDQQRALVNQIRVLIEAQSGLTPQIAELSRQR